VLAAAGSLIMGSFVAWVRRLLPRFQRQRPRLTRARAVELARAAAADDPHAADLAMTVLDDRPEGLVWIVREPVLGHTLFVEVDDASERILRIAVSTVDSRSPAMLSRFHELPATR
jgi:hypothetical protein